MDILFPNLGQTLFLHFSLHCFVDVFYDFFGSFAFLNILLIFIVCLFVDTPAWCSPLLLLFNGIPCCSTWYLLTFDGFCCNYSMISLVITKHYFLSSTLFVVTTMCYFLLLIQFLLTNIWHYALFLLYVLLLLFGVLPYCITCTKKFLEILE